MMANFLKGLFLMNYLRFTEYSCGRRRPQAGVLWSAPTRAWWPQPRIGGDKGIHTSASAGAWRRVAWPAASAAWSPADHQCLRKRLSTHAPGGGGSCSRRELLL